MATTVSLDAHSTFHVMIVEDDFDDAFLLRKALQRAAIARHLSLTASHYADGWVAIRAVGRRDLLGELPDLVIVDLNMPVMDGSRFIRLIREELRLPDLPAFVLTTSSRREAHEEARLAGAEAIFVKPNTQMELLAMANEMIDRVAARHAACSVGDDGTLRCA